MNFYKHFIFACFLAFGICAMSCSDEIFSTDNNSKDGQLHFIAEVVQNNQLTKDSRAAQPADACIEARNISETMFQGKKMWLQDRTINGIFSSSKNKATTRGDIIPADFSYLNENDIKLSLWGYRKEKEQDKYDEWLNKETLNINKDGLGTFEEDPDNPQKYLWSYNKPYCKFVTLCTNENPDDENGESSKVAYTYDYNKEEQLPQIKFESPDDVSKQFDLLAASTDVNYNTQAKDAPINLKLRHALTAVQFSINLGKLPDEITLTAVQLKNIVTKGIYTFPTAKEPSGSWSFSKDDKGTLSLTCIKNFNNDDDNTITLGKDPCKEKGDDGEEFWSGGDGNTFFVIPQDYADIKVCLTLHNDFKDKDQYLEVPLGKGEFEAGQTKILKLSAHKSLNTLITKGPKLIFINAKEAQFSVFSYLQKGPNENAENAPWEYVGYEDSDNKLHENSTPDWIKFVTKSGEGGNNKGNKIEIKPLILTTSYPWDNEFDKTEKAPKPYNLANANGEANIEETANCYIISSPGIYSIPLVYGNAIKNGKPYKASFHYNGKKPKDDKKLDTFINYAGREITSPYINEDNTNDKATKAELLWEDRENMLSVVPNIVSGTQSYDYLTFTVSSDQIKSGNALIAVKNNNGTIMWSWHLWFVPAKEYGKTVQLTDMYGTQRHVAKLPLGYIPFLYGPNEKYPRKVKLVFTQTYNNKIRSKFTVEQETIAKHLFYTNYYQHGRKDPFSGDVAHKQDGKITCIDGTKTLAYAIQNPNQLINHNYMTNWCSNTYFNLWSANFSILDEKLKLSNNVKTIYDPCPVGYKVPPVNTFTDMEGEGTGYDKDKYGWTFKTDNNKESLFIPMTGGLIYKNGKLEPNVYVINDENFPYPDAQGFYQLATSNSILDKENNSRCRLLLDKEGYNNKPNDKDNNMAEADAILPVKDE
nr:hypothetical protein [uncultured Prevotella sp.]